MCAFPTELPPSGKSLYEKGLNLPKIPAGKIPAVIREKCAPSDTETFGKGAHTLHILPEACTELFNWVQYGKKRAFNACELQYQGMGHIFLDSDRKIQAVVTRILPILSVSRTPTHVQMITESNDAMLEILANERKIQNRLEAKYNTDENGHTIDPFLSHGPSKVMFFGHTHPGLGCSFSSVDHQSNYSTPTDPVVTFVCDPIRKDMAAMVGVDAEDMKVVVYHPKAAVDAIPDTANAVPAPDPATESDPEPIRFKLAPPQVDQVDALWQSISSDASLLLRQVGIRGTFDCHRKRRGELQMCFKVVYRPSFRWDIR